MVTLVVAVAVFESETETDEAVPVAAVAPFQVEELPAVMFHPPIGLEKAVGPKAVLFASLRADEGA
jgi:hypothetical protein